MEWSQGARGQTFFSDRQTSSSSTTRALAKNSYLKQAKARVDPAKQPQAPFSEKKSTKRSPKAKVNSKPH
ncbi:hypothetical protein WAI453_009078 [Rhynchosporium graminicola]